MREAVKDMVLSKEDKVDQRISWAVVMYFLTQAINMTIKTVLPVPARVWGLISALFGVVIVLFFLGVFSAVYRRSSNLLWKSYATMLFVFLISAVLIILREEPISVLVNPYILNVFVFWLPTGICAASIKNKKVLYDTFIRTSYFLFVLAVICFFGGKVGNENESSYNMQLGFTLIIPTLFHLNEVFKGRYVFLLFFIIEIGIIITYASRGVLLSLAFFIVYKTLVEHKNLLFSFLTIFLTVFLLINIQDISLFILDILGDFNMSSRTLMRIVDNSLQESSGREAIWAICGKMMWVHPISGWGLGGECYEIYKQYGSMADFGYGYSPHNAILQLLLQFGIVLGALVSFFFLLPIFRMNRVKDVYRYYIILIFCSAIVIPCCYSAGDIFLKPAVAIYLYCFYFDIIKNNTM